MKLKPYKYQEDGAAYAMDKQRIILGDDVGLGKTVQSITAIDRSELFPCLVICPASLKINWQREWAMWARKRRVMILSDMYKHSWMDFIGARNNLFGDDYLADVVICNYESLKKYFVHGTVKGKRLNQIQFSPYIKNFKSVIIDELHRCKDSASQVSKLTKGLSSGKQMILGLTGTPVVNKPIDLLPQLAIIDQLQAFGGVAYFKNFYADGNNNTALLEKMKETCYIRREKTEVLKELPDKIKTKLYVELTNRDLYDSAQRDIVAFIREHEDRQITRNARAQLMVKIIKLRQLSALGKLKHVKDYVDNMVHNMDKKVILFTMHNETVDRLTEMYPKSVKIVGGQSQADRQFAIDRFQRDEHTKIIICNIKAAGVGITLTAASVQLFVELPWTSADLVQGEGRAHRNGQKDSVNCIYMMGENTIDNWMYSKIETKRIMGNEISGSQEPGIDEEKTKNDLISALMRGEVV